jgi:hypothetical protein
MIDLKATVLLMAGLLVAVCSSAQVRKCTGADGKVTYSDFVCGGTTSRESLVRTDVNNIDHSSSRQEVQQARATAELENLLQSPPSECKFKSYKNGDARGKVLADKAELECVRNIGAKKQGLPTATDDYEMWRGHHTLEASKRISRAPAPSAPATPISCMPNGFGGLRCQ